MTKALSAKIFGTALAVALLALASLALADTTVVVSGNTSSGENQLGWMFNRDALTATPFEFNTDKAVIGSGSLFVAPITNTGNGNSDKFIGELFLLTPIADIQDISIDYAIASTSDEADEQHFYFSVYAVFGGSSPTKFYDCRYNVIANNGVVDGFATLTFDPDASYSVTTRTGGDPSPYACPASPADMDNFGTGTSSIRVIAINIGDTSVSGSDTGVGGYLDKAVVHTASEVTTYDFDPLPPPPPPPAPPKPTKGIEVKNNAFLKNITVSRSGTGDNAAQGSKGGKGAKGGRGARGGDASNNEGGPFSGNNNGGQGGAGGQGGSGGNGGAGGLIVTGDAASKSGTKNTLNDTRIIRGR